MTFRGTHPNLASYVERMNVGAKLFPDPLFPPINLSFFTEADRRRIRDRLERDMSPENLTCDGELTGTALAKRVLFLENVIHELESYK